eukprot:maker-scaffold139_size317827-snap-gene-1.22 protein:Tk05012 transcript:maker-scaffold139_size317827-snap-gene-1.22-mRNA-1 annotation:"GI13416"
MEAWQNYLEWIRRNPTKVSDVENGIKWASLAITIYLKRSKNSFILSEIIHKCGAVIQFCHDRAFESANVVIHHVEYSKLECFLGLLETSEVILELSGQIIGGHAGQWLVIVVVQACKAVLRLTLLFKRRQMLRHPTVEPLIRDGNRNTIPKFDTLKSGQVIRKLDPHHAALDRSWEIEGDALTGVTGKMALSSSQALYQPEASSLGPREKMELARRRSRLLWFLLRSPFYDAYTKRLLFTVLLFAQKNIPI